MVAAPQNQPGELQVLDETDEIAAVRLEGEFDMANAPQIIDASERLLADNKQVILDLSAATFIDCSVVHALSHVQTEATKRGCIVVMQLGTAAIVERVIEISKIDRLLPRVSTRAAAIDTIHKLRAAA